MFLALSTSYFKRNNFWRENPPSAVIIIFEPPAACTRVMTASGSAKPQNIGEIIAPISLQLASQQLFLESSAYKCPGHLSQYPRVSNHLQLWLQLSSSSYVNDFEVPFSPSY